MERLPETRSPLASAAAASLALHAAVVLAVILWAADSAPRLIVGGGGGVIAVSLVDDAASHGQTGGDRQDAGITARPARAAADRRDKRAPEKRVSAAEASMRETPPRGDAGTELAVTGAVFPAQAGTAGVGVAVAGAAEAAGRGVDAAGAQITGAIPRYRDNPRPDYPRAARLKGWEGLVLVDAEVGADGTVEDVRLKASSGHAVLDRSALAAVRDWKFEPGRRMGVPVRMRVDVPVRFVLRE
ncbi:MAG: energy transducer TonB [Syntrophaceae bacterium]|nr:energy transducer TonB [Syntrophaceae bacterium]